jgi:hypothetical protein
MRLYATCSKCKSDISFWSWKETRMDFKKSKHEKISLTCKKCNHLEKYHIDLISAKNSKIAIIIGLMIFVFGTLFSLIFLWDYLFESNNVYTIFGLISILLIPSIVYGIISKNDVQRIRNFNRS